VTGRLSSLALAAVLVGCGGGAAGPRADTEAPSRQEPQTLGAEDAAVDEPVVVPRAGRLDKGPFSGDFAALTVAAAPGDSAPLKLTVRASRPMPAGQLSLAVPDGVALSEGEPTRPLSAWSAGEERTFSWVVSVGQVEGGVILARVQAGDEGRGFAVTVNPTKAAGEVREGSRGKLLRVREVGGSAPP
jgi:hypothetical protein